jgi:hypothetical protein
MLVLSLLDAVLSIVSSRSSSNAQFKCCRSWHFEFGLYCFCLGLWSFPVAELLAQQNSSQHATGAPQGQQPQTLSPQDIDRLTAQIALYPDALIA